MAAGKSRGLREGEVCVDCAAARRLYEEAKLKITGLNKLLQADAFASGPLSRIRGVDEPDRGPKATCRMQRASVARFARTCQIRVEELLTEGTGLNPATDIECGTDGPTMQSLTPTPETALAGARPRAWIRVLQAEIASPLIFAAGDWGRLTVKFRLGNAGDAPASFVTTASTIIPFEADQSPLDTMEAICQQQPSQGQGFTLFPGEVRDWSNDVVMDPSAVNRVKQKWELANEKVNVLFAGCVSYTSAGSKRSHKTPYLYEVYQTLNAELVGIRLCRKRHQPGPAKPASRSSVASGTLLRTGEA